MKTGQLVALTENCDTITGTLVPRWYESGTQFRLLRIDGQTGTVRDGSGQRSNLPLALLEVVDEFDTAGLETIPARRRRVYEELPAA